MQYYKMKYLKFVLLISKYLYLIRVFVIYTNYTLNNKGYEVDIPANSMFKYNNVTY